MTSEDLPLYFGRQLGLWEHAIDEALENDHLAMTESAVRASVKADFHTPPPRPVNTPANLP